MYTVILPPKIMIKLHAVEKPMNIDYIQFELFVILYLIICYVITKYKKLSTNQNQPCVL